jgi:hypothetical protein
MRTLFEKIAMASTNNPVESCSVICLTRSLRWVFVGTCLGLRRPLSMVPTIDF